MQNCSSESVIELLVLKLYVSCGQGEHDATIPCETTKELYCGTPTQRGKQLVILNTSARGSLVVTARLDEVTGVILSIVPSWHMIDGCENLPA
jgi:hypothetical protein